jgi:hypothetical protein
MILLSHQGARAKKTWVDTSDQNTRQLGIGGGQLTLVGVATCAVVVVVVGAGIGGLEDARNGRGI